MDPSVQKHVLKKFRFSQFGDRSPQHVDELRRLKVCFNIDFEQGSPLDTGMITVRTSLDKWIDPFLARVPDAPFSFLTDGGVNIFHVGREFRG